MQRRCIFIFLVVDLLLLTACSHHQSKNEAVPSIKIEKPLSDAKITSPLTIKGKAKGPWYFEGTFPVELLDTDGHKLAQGQAKAQGKWTTGDFVPFKLTLKFDAPADQHGRLIFHRANPSGKPQNEIQYTLSVNFPPN